MTAARSSRPGTQPRTGLGADFFERSVHAVARDLIGCRLLYDGAGGTIVETESYERDDPACHAYVGLTERTAVLFGPPGRAYVYFSYGIHALLNAVCEADGIGAAVLIRALEPVDGIDLMRERRGVEPLHELCNGPGKLTQALGVGLDLNDTSLLGDGPIQILEPAAGERPDTLAIGERIGITKAADLPWRYGLASSRFLSRRL